MSETAAIGARVGVLEHMTGVSRGQCAWLTGDDALIALDPGGRARLLPSGTAPVPPSGQIAARITRAEDGFHVSAPPGALLWINGRPVRAAALRPGDMIEFGDLGPLSRFRVFDDRSALRPSVAGIMGDAWSYLRSSRRPLPRRLARAGAGALRRLARDTTWLFRGGVILAILALAGVVALDYRAGQRLQARFDADALQVEAIAAELAQARREALRQADLDRLRDSLGERLDSLETRSDAARIVLARARPSVVFLQAGYGLRHRQTGQMLRHVLGPDGRPAMAPSGRPRLALGGDGPVAEVQVNGTGFVLAGAGAIVTNRHVARPWETAPGVQGGDEQMEPVMTRFLGYMPDRTRPVALELWRASDEADLALLRPAEAAGGTAEGDTPLPPGLTLAPAPAAPGETVLVMGYPTGLMSMLAQAGEGFRQELRASGRTGFWQIAEALAEAGRIAPLASRGIIGQAGDSAVTYDAETTHGGSGGPVLDSAGRVLAVNTAIMPEFGGSNLGVPAARVAQLLAEAQAAR